MSNGRFYSITCQHTDGEKGAVRGADLPGTMVTRRVNRVPALCHISDVQRGDELLVAFASTGCRYGKVIEVAYNDKGRWHSVQPKEVLRKFRARFDDSTEADFEVLSRHPVFVIDQELRAPCQRSAGAVERGSVVWVERAGCAGRYGRVVQVA